MPKYRYPDNVTSPALLNKIANRGVSFKISRESMHFIRKLDSQTFSKKAIFGSGWLLSEKAAAEKAAAIVWELSEREKQIIAKLK